MFSGIKPYLSGFTAEKWVVAAALAISATIILSNIIGFFRLDMPFILLVAIVVSLRLLKGYESQAMDRRMFLLAPLLFVLLIYPIILVTPVFPASNDAASTTAMRVMDEKIELDYGQYGKINNPYPIGLPVMAKALNSTALAGLPDYLSPYAVALVAGILQIFFVYLIASKLFGDKRAGIICAALLFASKFIFENIYVGELAWYLGSALMLGFIYLLLKGSRLKYVVFPSIFIAHPIAGFNTLLFLAAYYLANRKNFPGEPARLFFSLVVIIPGIALTYLPILVNLSGGQTGTSESLGTLKLLSMLPFWVGTGLTLIAVAVIAYIVLARKQISIAGGHRTAIALFAVSMAALVALESVHFMLSLRVIELIILSMIFIIGALISDNKLGLMAGKREAAVILAVLLIGMVFYSTSSILSHYRSGSKISAEGMEFSAAFRQFDGGQKKALFLTKWGGKIAEYSNKIPYDITAAHSIISYDFMYYHDAAFYEMREKRRIWEGIFLRKNTGLIDGIDVDYIVVDRNEFSPALNYPVVFEYKDFRVYQKS